MAVQLQAYFDDSGGKRQGQWMVMCGLLAEAQVFADLSNEWARHLAGPYPPGRIDYFKMDEAVTLSGEFKFWSTENRDAKVWQLSKLLDRGDMLHLGARVSIPAYERMAVRWRHIKAQKGAAMRFHSMDQPYLMLFQVMFTMAISESVRLGASTPIDVIFDEHNLFRDSIMAAYSDWRDVYADNPAESAVLPYYPLFRDDKTFLPIQAADMLAGELRLASEDYSDNPPFIGYLCPNLPISPLFVDIGDEIMGLMHADLLRSAMRDGIDLRPRPVDDLDCS